MPEPWLTEDEDRPQAHQRRRRGWRGFSATLAPWHDLGAYDDILATISREGRYDALGCDLVPAMYDNGNYPVSPLSDAQRAATAAKGYHPRNAALAARLVAEYEDEQRAKQLERERIAAIAWEADASRRECIAAWEGAASSWRHREATMAGLRRLAETRRGPPKRTPPAAAIEGASAPIGHCPICGDGRFCDGGNPRCIRHHRPAASSVAW